MAINKPKPKERTIVMFDADKKQPQNDDPLVLRSAFGTPLPVSRKTGFYQFRTKPQHIVLEISNNADDYMSGSVDRSSVVQLAQTWCAYAKKYLELRGYSVSFKVVPKWTTRSNYGYDPDEQKSLREEIWSSFLDPRNFGRKLEDYEGLRKPVQRSLIDTGVKSE
jgi:hypothetical protein